MRKNHRDASYGHIERRVHTMLDRGWLKEVGGVVRCGVSIDAKPFNFIGYS